MKTYSKIIAAVLCTLGVVSLQAQNQDEYNENVTINVSFDPMVTDANKINQNPSIFDTSFTNVDMSFERLLRKYDTNLSFDTIKAAQVKGEPVAQLYKLHLKGGLGWAYGGKELSNGFVPLLQASYTSLRDRKLLYGVDVYSRSALAGAKEFGHNSFSNSDINLWGKRIFNSYALTSQIFYNYSRNYWYGSRELSMDEYDKKDYRIAWNNIGFNLGYNKLERDESFQHKAFFEFDYSSTKQNRRELDLHFTLDAYKNLNLISKASNQILGLSFDYKHAFSSLTHLDSTYNRALFNIAPYLIFDYNKFHFFASLAIIPGINTYQSLQILPTATISFELIQQLLSFYGGIKSESKMPMLKELTRHNPYLSPSAEIFDESYTNIFAKAFLAISPKFSVSLEGGYTSLRNTLFYQSTYCRTAIDSTFANTCAQNPYNQFQTLYTNGNKLYATLETSFTIANSFRAEISATYQNITREDDFQAWYCPNFMAKAKMSYTWDKLNIMLSPAFYSRMSAAYFKEDTNNQTYTIKEVKLRPIIDLNLSASYNYTDQWSFFLNLENLAFQQYRLLYNYPVYEFTVIAGVGYKF